MNDFLAIIIASFIYTGISLFWYSPALFGKTWYQVKGFMHEDIRNKKLAKDVIFKSLCVAFLISSIFSIAPSLLGFYEIEYFLRLAFIVGLLAMCVEFSKYLWEQENFQLVLLNSLFHFTGYVSIVVVLFYI